MPCIQSGCFFTDIGRERSNQSDADTCMHMGNPQLYQELLVYTQSSDYPCFGPGPYLYVHVSTKFLCVQSMKEVIGIWPRPIDNFSGLPVCAATHWRGPAVPVHI